MPFIHWLDDYTDTLQQFIASHIVLAPLLLLFVEEAGIPILVPGDVIIAYTGYTVTTTQQASIAEAFVMSQLSVIGGATILFFVSRRWGQILIEKIGAFIFLDTKHILKAERMFAKYGILAIIFGRHIPGLRIPITVFAATSGVSYPVFIFSTIVSTTLWILFYLNVGVRLGVNFNGIFQRYLGVSIGIIIGLTVAILALHIIGAYREKHRSKK